MTSKLLALLFVCTACAPLLADPPVQPSAQTGASSTAQGDAATQWKYDSLSAQALGVPASALQSTKLLAAYLTAPAKSDVEKAWSIFIWVNAYGGTPHPNLGVTMIDCLGHAQLFQKLTSEAGLKSDIVGGYGRGLSDLGSAQYDSHSWNIMFLDGKWQIVEPTWEAQETKNGQIIRYANPYYFLMPPEQVVLIHLPNELKNELLPRPLSKADLESKPYPTAYFYENGLSMISNPGPEITAINGNAEVVIGNPGKVPIIAQLLQNGRELPADQWLRGEQQADGYHQLIRLPQPGTYVLRFQVKSRQHVGQWWDTALSYRVNAYAVPPISEPKQ